MNKNFAITGVDGYIAQGYLDMLELEQSSRMILTDSSGIQKESYWLIIPCFTLLDETEWPETTHGGWNVPVGADEERIFNAVSTFRPREHNINIYSDASAACTRAEPTIY